MSLEDTKNVSGFFGEQELFRQSVLTPEEIYKRIDKVTLDNIYFEAKKLFKPERLSLAMIGPFKDSKKFIQLIK